MDAIGVRAEGFMHRTTINVSESVFQQARIKALQENVTVSEVVSDLLARWVAGEIDTAAREGTRAKLTSLAHDAQGMWADRDPDAYLAASRAGLKERDRELT
jgi:hypothetical protein